LNFGTGSSREQAAAALKFKGIPLRDRRQFFRNLKRDTFNNGFVVFECSELVAHLRTALTNHAPPRSHPKSQLTAANRS
jgi:homoaconitate hydratase